MSKKAELIVEGRTLAVSNLDKVLYPKAGFTKGEVIDYYIRIAPVLLPHLKDRPLTMKRYPNGVEGEFFYEKNCPAHRPTWVQDGEGLERRQPARDALLPRAGSADAGLGGQPRRHRIAHLALAQEGRGASDDDGLRSRSRRTGRHRAVLSGRPLAAGDLAGNETEKLGEDLRLERSAGLRPAQHAGHLRPDKRAYRTPSPNISSASIRSWSFPKWRKRCAKEKSSSTGARTTSTRRRSASIRCARKSSRPFRRR